MNDLKQSLTDYEINKLLRIAGTINRVYLCDEAILLFLLTTGMKISDLLKLKVSDAMNEDGTWKDVVSLKRFKGFGVHDDGFLFLTNKKLRIVLDKYCDVRLTKRHKCTLNWNIYRGLEPESLLLLNYIGEEFQTVKTMGGNKKYTVIQEKIRHLFELAKIKSEEVQYTQICFNTFYGKLAQYGFTAEESKSIRMGTQTRLLKHFSQKDLIKIQNIIRKLYGSVKTSIEQTAPKTIYHYCTSESFIEIIKSGALWFSDLLKMNDPNEIIKNLELSKDVSHEVMNEKNTYGNLMDDSKFGSMRVFSCSFSKRKDDLNQWRSYSSDGSGVNIGFNKKKLEECLTLFDTTNHKNTFSSQSMDSFNIEEIYYDDDSKKSIEEKFKALWHNYQKTITNHDVDVDDISEQIRAYIWRTSSIHKSKFYADEEEIRAFRRAKLNDDKLIDNIEYRNGIYGLTSYIILQIKDAISEVILGPKCLSSIDDVKYFLNAHNIKNVKVEHSKGEYR